MTATNIALAARTLINAVSDDLYSDAEVLGYVNRGQERMVHFCAAMKTQLLHKKATWTTVAGTDSYTVTAIASDFYAIAKIFKYGTKLSLPVYNMEQQNMGYKLDAVEAYYPPNASYGYCYFAATKIYITPTPTAADVYDFWYHYLPADLTGSDSPSWLPAPYHEILAYYSAIRMLKKDEKDYSAILADYKEFRKDLLVYCGMNRDNANFYEAAETW